MSLFIICKNYKTKCERKNCPFIHENNKCYFYIKYGLCKYKNECSKTH